jgi:hypothetical protein
MTSIVRGRGVWATESLLISAQKSVSSDMNKVKSFTALGFRLAAPRGEPVPFRGGHHIELADEDEYDVNQVRG